MEVSYIKLKQWLVGRGCFIQQNFSLLATYLKDSKSGEIRTWTYS